MPSESTRRPDSARTLLRDLVAECLLRLEQDGPAALDAVCAENPGQAAELREMVGQLRDVGLLAGGKEGDFPERLGEFRLLARLGGGGMGVVYLAEQAALHRHVALKLIRPDLLYFSGARERFRREVEAVARLQHAGIVPVLTGGEERGIPWFAMELVQGATLQEVLDRLAGSDPARLKGSDLRAAMLSAMEHRAAPDAGANSAGSVKPTGGATGAGASAAGSASGSGEASARLFGGSWVAACLGLARAVAEALQHAHERGILHRDVKPSNIMVTPEGRVLLLDFGLAQAEGNARVTRTGSHLGSLAYMSPEQARGEHAAIREASDVYSLGATLYELLALRSPFADVDDASTRRAILEGRCIPLRQLDAAVSRDAENVCLKAMDLQPERRYATAAAFAQDLGNALHLRPVLARRPSALLKARRWAQRHPAAAACAVLGGVLLVGGPLAWGIVQARAAEKEQAFNAQLLATNTELDHALGTLQEAHVALDGKRVELEHALGAEQRERQRAEKGFDRTLAAVDEMLATVGADDLRDVPQLEPVRKHLLERALDFYRALEKEQPGDVDVRREQARTHRSIADLLTELGRGDEADALYRQSVADMRALLLEDPRSDDLRHAFASTLSQLGRAAYLDSRMDEAREHWAEARVELERLVAAPGASAAAPPVAPTGAPPVVPPLYLHDLALCLEGLGLVAQSQGAMGEAFDFYRQAAERAGTIAAAHPGEASFVALHAVTLGKAALICMDEGRADEAELLFRKAWTATAALLAAEAPSRRVRTQAVECASNYGVLLLTRSDRALAESVLRRGFEVALQLTRDYPAERDYRKRCAVIALNVVAELVQQKRFGEAQPMAKEAVAQLERLVAEQPERLEYPYYLGAGYSAEAAVALELGARDEALKSAHEAVALLRGVHEELPGDAGVSAQYVAGLAQLAECEFAFGDIAGALGTLDEARSLDVKRADVLFQVAVTLARGMTAVAESPSLPPAESEALLEDIGERALAALRAAIENGFTDTEPLRTDADFALLRARPDFEEAIRKPVKE